MISTPPADVHAVALAIYHEARNQPKICQLWVGSVVKNRMKTRSMTAREVISEKKQFTWYHNRKIIKEPEAFQKSVDMAKIVLSVPQIVRYEYFHRGKRGGVVCGDQVFRVAYR